MVLELGSDNVVAANLIGTSAAGTAPLGNATDGITIDESSANTIGGSTSGSGNVIAGNFNGVDLTGAVGTTDNVLWGNLIGTDLTGTLPIGNANDGVIVQDSATDNAIGETVIGVGAGNTIGFNAAAGVQVFSSTGNTILANAVFDNDGGGIVLYGALEASYGEPVLSGAIPNAADQITQMQGTFDPGASHANETFLIEFFGNASTDQVGRYEGQTFLGAGTVTTNGSGAASIDINLQTVVASGTYVTATATSTSALNTTEFSSAVEAIDVFLVTTLDSSGSGSLNSAITYSNAFPSISPAVPNEIEFQLPTNFDTIQTITLTTALPEITTPVVIDGYTQAGSYINYSPASDDDIQTDVASITVRIDGSQLSPALDANGLELAAPNCTVDGLSITGFQYGAGIAVEPPSGGSTSGALGDDIWGNWIGVGQFNPDTFDTVVPAGNPQGNEFGIWVASSNNVIGGNSYTARNVIQGNLVDGVVLYGNTLAAGENQVENNFILDNGGDGVLITSPDNQIGLPTAAQPTGAGNVISGNTASGIHILGPAAQGNVIVNNQIGTQIGEAGLQVPLRGTRARPNVGDGVLIENAPANVVGGLIPNAGNTIAADGGDGVGVENYNSGTVPSSPLACAAINVVGTGNSGTGNIIEGNDIGASIEIATVYTMANRDGVDISSSSNTVGGNTEAAQNVIISNGRNGVTITSSTLDTSNNALAAIPNAAPAGNVIAGNFIGTTLGTDDYGNVVNGVFLYDAYSNTIGGATASYANVIAGSHGSGVVLAGAGSTGNVVASNLIGTTLAGNAPNGNVAAGVVINGAVNNTIGGKLGSSGNLISGNAVGVSITGAAATGNTIVGNLIGTDESGTLAIPNSQDGIRIDAAIGNTIGGTSVGAANVISANQTGIEIDQDASANVVLGNAIGTTASGQSALGNTLYGVLVTGAPAAGQPGDTIGGTAAEDGNLIAFNLQTGVSIQNGAGNSILSDLIYSNGTQEISLAPNGNDGQSAPNILGVASGATPGTVQGTLASRPDIYLIQFFTSFTLDASGAAQGEALIGSLVQVITANPATEAYDFDLPVGVPYGTLVTAIATDERTGDSSTFAVSATATPVSVEFQVAQVAVTVSASGGLGGTATINVVRSGNLAVTVSVNYATTAGSAIANEDYTPSQGTLTFPGAPTDAALESFNVPILVNPARTTSPLTLGLVLYDPTGGATTGLLANATLLIVDTGTTITRFDVVNTAASGPGSLAAAIAAADLDTNPGTADVVFHIPTSTTPNLDVPVSGFDPSTQTWHIDVTSQLPAITRPTSIDGYSEANLGLFYNYPDQVSSTVETLTIGGTPTGGTFTLTTAAPLPSAISAALPFDATASEVQAALSAIIGAGNVAVTGGPLPANPLTLTFQGAYTDQDIPTLYPASSLTGGTGTSIDVETTTVGGIAAGMPTEFASVTNTTAALEGNDAQVRIVIDGSATSGLTGLIVNASNSEIRGLAIEGFRARDRDPERGRCRRFDSGQLHRPVPRVSGRSHDGRRVAVAEFGRAGRRGKYPGAGAGFGQCDDRRRRNARCQRDRRQRGARRAARAGRVGQSDLEQPDRNRGPEQRGRLL